MQAGAAKRKGNRFENKMSKLISAWMFGDKNVLGRHATSGAQKNVYVGDVVPVKITNFSWCTWPFVIELKNGYKNEIPDFFSQTIIHKWIDKLFEETTKTQYIPWLIVQFHRKQPLLFTTMQLNFWSDIAMTHVHNDNIYIFYVYNYKHLMDTVFKDIIPEDLMKYLNEAPKDPHLRSTTYNKSKAKQSGGKKLHTDCSDVLDQILG